MAEQTNVREHFTQPMLRHFLPPQVDDEEALWRDFQTDLGGFSATVLSEAAARLRRREGGSLSFPRLGECLSMCRYVMDEQNRAKAAFKRSSAEESARRAHLDRLNSIHLEGDTDRAARLLIILATRSTMQDADFGTVSFDVRRRAVNAMNAPKWLLNGKRP